MTAYPTQLINIFAQHTAPVEHHGIKRTFRTPDGAERFMALVGKRATSGHAVPKFGTTRASAVHLPAQRTGDRPLCVIRAGVKASLTVERTPPPDRPRPPKALRIVRAAESAAA